ncbi:MAG: hypothetical protein RLZZ200_1608, partial [Pseudomonadota bacterium]
IATPASTHYPLALASLQAGKHVLIEKPLSVASQEATRLIEEADKRGRVLMVDHTFVYTPAVSALRDIVTRTELGDLLSFDAVRIGRGRYQSDVNVLWDLAVHDLAILDYLLGERLNGSYPVAVTAFGRAHRAGFLEDTATLRLLFDGPLSASVHASWLGPQAARRVRLVGSRGIAVCDDLQPLDKVSVYEHGVVQEANDNLGLPGPVVGRCVRTPHLSDQPSLDRVASHFVECVRTGTRPLTGGEAGLRVIRILEAAAQSMVTDGQPVRLEDLHCRV